MSKRVVNILFDENDNFRYSSKLSTLKEYLEDDVKVINLLDALSINQFYSPVVVL